MDMSNWAKKEVELLSEKNGDDYVVKCAESAIRAFETLLEDGHSGLSINVTKNILNRLIDGKVLTPIEDTPDVWNDPYNYGKDYDTYQCKRMTSLFKRVYNDGTIEYIDVDRCMGIPIENPKCSYTSGRIRDIVDEYFPITMPYYPKDKKYKIYTDDFLYNKDSGDFDCEAFYYMITPNGEKIELNRFYYYPDNDTIIELTKEEYEKMKSERVK